MDDSTPDSPAEGIDVPAARGLPRHTTPTWEMELLLSGATVFGLLQVPAWIDATADRLRIALPQSWDAALLLGPLFAKVMAYGLIFTFLLHLATRAYWVALVGLRSVYPHGIRWDRVHGGPIGKRHQQRILSDPDASIERADNASTLVFATGITVVVMFLFASLLSGIAVLIGGALQTWVYPLRDSSTWFFVALASMMLPLILLRVVDAWFGGKVRPGSRLAIAIDWMYGRYESLGLNRSSPLLLLLTSNARRKHGLIWLIALLNLLMAAVQVMDKARHEGPSWAWIEAVPAELDTDQSPDYYAQSGNSRRLLPRIQSDIVTDPYLRLWVPLDPDRARAFNRACTSFRPHSPAATTARADEENALAQCLGALFLPRLDAHPLSGLQWRFARDPDLGVDGLRAYIPLQATATGRHELLLLPPAKDDGDQADAARTWRIPFWR